EPATHVGFYLVNIGRKRLEGDLHYRPVGLEWVRWRLLGSPTITYLGSIAILTGIIMGVLLYFAFRWNIPLLQMIGIGLLSLVAVLTVATGLVNWAITFILSPRILPRLDFEDEIPATCRTMVVIPTILATIAESESSLQELELQYVRNTDPHLTFGL